MVAGSTSTYTCVSCNINNGFYTDGVYCYKCSSIDCDVCAGDNGSICKKCSPGKFLLEGKCVECMQEGYF